MATGRVCNVVFGRTGCGKTSLRKLLIGEWPEPDSMTSGTSDAQVLDVTIEGDDYLYVDTAGILDNRGDGQELAQSRSVKVNSIGDLLKKENLSIARVFYCVASTERFLKEEIDWLADIVQMMGGEKIMRCFAIVLTKVDAGFQKQKFEKTYDTNDVVVTLKKAFPGCPIVTAGFDNVAQVKGLLVPTETDTPFKVGPEEIKTIKPKADLETQMHQVQQKLASMESMLSSNIKPEHMQSEINDLEDQIDEMSDRIAHNRWWCPRQEVAKANSRIKECRQLIKDLRENQGQSKEQIAKFEKAKQKLIDELRQLQADMAEKNRLGGIFKLILGKSQAEAD